MGKKRKTVPPVGKSLAMTCAMAANDKKAQNIVVLDMRAISSIADYFVICSGTSGRQVKAIARAVEEGGGTRGARCHRREGWADAHWIVLDFVDVIVHVFLEETRRHYHLERLWGDADKISMEHSLCSDKGTLLIDSLQ